MHKTTPWLRFIIEGTDGGAGTATADSSKSGDEQGGSNSSEGKTLTQDEVNRLLADQKRKYQERYADYDQIRTERDELLERTRTEQERAVAEAQQVAREQAMKEAREGLLPKMQRTQAENIALRAGLGTADQVNAWLETADLSKFAADDGSVQEAELMAALTALFGAAPARYDGLPGTGDRGARSAWDSGVEEARRRFNKNT